MKKSCWKISMENKYVVASKGSQDIQTADKDL
jgi:hypothetical protein